MANALYRQLLGQADRLARFDPKRPNQGNLRRAVSTTYYALFHFLVDQATRSIIGSKDDRRAYRDVLARAFTHTNMLDACKKFSSGTLRPAITPAGFVIGRDLRSVARTFADALEQRQRADYDLRVSFRRVEVLSLIADVEEAIRVFRGMRGSIEARFFLSCLLAWGNLKGRA